MEYRAMEKLGVQASLLGFGCMRFPKRQDGGIEEQEAEKMLDGAILNGVNYIDTAYFYHEGKSEAFVGRVLKKYPRDMFLLATKMPMVTVRSLERAREIFAEQLERLQVEYFDFYLLHALDREKWERAKALKIVEFLEEMKAQGKIRFLGFSFHDQYDVFEEILTQRPWDFCQVQLNYMDTEHQQGMRGYALAEKLAVPLIVMEPVKGGALAALPSSAEALLKAYDPEKSMASWALRWVANLPQVKVILSGMSTFAQVKDNLATFSAFLPLSEEESALVARVAQTVKARRRNGCAGCEYCMPCPHGVNIPECFKVWNEFFMYGDIEKANRSYYTMMDKKERAAQCRGCGACEKKCPQQIKIRRDLFHAAVDLAPDKLGKNT